MSPFLGEISRYNRILLGIVFSLVILQYKNYEKNSGTKKKKKKSLMKSLLPNRCSKELYENKKNIWFTNIKYQDWLVLLILNVLAIKSPIHINYIPLLSTEIKDSLISRSIVIITFYKL